MGRMVCWHRKYDLGDQHDYADPIEFLQDMAMTFFKEKPEQVFEYIKAGRDSEARLEYDGKHRRWRLMELCSFGGEGKWYEVANYDQLMQNKHISSDAYYDVIHAMSTHGLISMLESIDGFVFLPLYLFDHSGITMNTSGFSCPWDSGQVGWIFCTPDILSLNKRLDRETDADKRQAILDQIAATEAGIQELYEGTEEAEGLYALMRRAAQLTVERAGIDALYQTSMLDQEEIEQRFAVAMGDMLRDGYWSNTAYAPGQENLLYLEAAEIMDT